jgi:hypothetical protein
MVQFLPQGLRQGRNSVLRGWVHIHVCTAEYIVSQDTVDVDDVTVDVVGFHDLDGFSGGNAQTQDVQIQNGLPVFGFTFCQVGGFSSTGVVDEDVNRSQVLCGPGEGLQDVFFFSEVGFDPVELPFLSGELLGMFFDEFRATGSTHHLEIVEVGRVKDGIIGVDLRSSRVRLERRRWLCRFLNWHLSLWQLCLPICPSREPSCVWVVPCL